MDKQKAPALDGAKLEQMVGGRGKELERFAAMVGASVTGAKKWFDGTQPSVGYFVSMAAYFRMSLDDLATELGLIDRPRRADALPPSLTAALRRALSDGVQPDTILQGIELAIIAHRGRDAASEQAASEENRPPKKGRAAL